jgi:hypothetical protein
VILTVEEAAKKQCRLCGPVPTNLGRVQTSGQASIGFLTCSGPACAHWRWADHPNQGFCGMAGLVLRPVMVEPLVS